MSKRIESPSTYGVYGYRNVWGGFHSTTDFRAYRNLFTALFEHINVHWVRFITTMIRDRWRHRRCDTTDFHHNVYCTLDPYGKKIDDDYRWSRVWADKREVNNEHTY